MKPRRGNLIKLVHVRDKITACNNRAALSLGGFKLLPAFILFIALNQQINSNDL